MKELSVFDEKLSKFDQDSFGKVRPYLNLLADHYGYPNSIQESTNGTVKIFEERVKEYFNDRSDENFSGIVKVFEDIRDKEQTTSLKDLIQAKANPFCLSVFFLAPLPRPFTYGSQIVMMRDSAIRNDKLLAYLATIRLVNIHRGFFILPLWLQKYDNPDFARMFGNILSFNTEPENCSTLQRLYQLLPSLKISPQALTDLSSSKFSFDEVIKHLGSTAKVFTYVNKIQLDSNLTDLIQIEMKEKSSISFDLIIVKTDVGITQNYVQVSETITCENNVFELKAMIVKREIGAKNERPALMLFDESFQFWTLFDEEIILSFPRQFARKYFNRAGSHLVYVKDNK